MTKNKRLLQVLSGERLDPPPIWLMRQAGRYLPEYRATRADAGGFLDLCYNPELAAEVTFQPIRRYGFDAAILFSDILVLPHALGQDVSFVVGEGPRLEPIRDEAGLANLDPERLVTGTGKVMEAVGRIRAGLPAETTLIGFCGAPWTVACYMVEGGGSKDFQHTKGWMYRDPGGFNRLIDLLVRSSIDYLSAQVAAGADCVQIFDTWAGLLAGRFRDRYVLQPMRQIVEGLLKRHSDLKILGFPRGIGPAIGDYCRETGVSAVSVDQFTDLASVLPLIPEEVAIQGNLDPILLVAGGPEMAREVALIRDIMQGRRHIFNLGHGIVPQTPPEHVAELVRLVREGR